MCDPLPAVLSNKFNNSPSLLVSPIQTHIHRDIYLFFLLIDDVCAQALLVKQCPYITCPQAFVAFELGQLSSYILSVSDVIGSQVSVFTGQQK